jgi:hypothetical protein
MGGWYTVGLAAGLGAAAGVLAAALLAPTRVGVPGAAILGGLGGLALAFLVGDWPELVAGALGGVLAGLGAAPVARGTLARGGTRGGTLFLLGSIAVGLAGLAFVPFAGYVAPAVLVLGARVRRRAGERYAGLRILARD